jgi:ribonuclease R
MSNNGESIQTTAERWSERMMRALYMADRVGEEYDAMISDVARFGAFVSVEEPYVEGLVPIRSLGGSEFLELDDRRARLVGQRTGQSFQVGDSIKVICSSVDVKQGRINFEPAEAPRSQGRRPNRRPKASGSRPPGSRPGKKRSRR